MDPVTALVQALLDAVEHDEVFWPGLGAFSLASRRRMPGFAGYRRLSFRPSEQLYRDLNDGEDPPMQDSGDTTWLRDPQTARRAASIVADELARRGEVTVAGLGLFAVETRRTTGDPYYFVSFHADPTVLRSLNPKQADYEAVLVVEWPAGPPSRPEVPEA